MASSPRRTKLVVIFGGRSAEHDVSRMTASHVLRAIDTDRYDVVPIGIERSGQWLHASEARAALALGPDAIPEPLVVEGPVAEPLPTLTRVDDEPLVVLPLLHGPFGEDGTIQGLLELADVPYVGAGVLGSSIAMDKAMAKEVIAQAGIPQAKHLSFNVHDLPDDLEAVLEEQLGWPVFVKPANLGSSIGVSKVKHPEQLEAAIALALSYDEWLVIEEGIDGREIELAVIGNEDPRVSVPGEILPGAEFYDYDDKYVDGASKTLIPARLDDATTPRLQELAIASYKALRAEGMARVDFFLEERRGPLLNEINTIPGFTPISMFPKLWQASGLDYPSLIDELIRLAIDRHDRRRSRTRTDR